MNKPTIYITDLNTSVKYKVVGVDKETSKIELLNTTTQVVSVENISDFSGAMFKVEKVENPTQRFNFGPHPIYDKPQDEGGHPSNPALVHEESKTGLTASQADAPTNQEVVILEVTNRKDALDISQAFKSELRPVLERAKLIEKSVAKYHKGEAKKIGYVIQWIEKYLAD